MKTPIKVLIKEPGSLPYFDEIPNELSVLQATVDGYIETVTIDSYLVVICNEEARLNLLPFNCKLCDVDFFGTIIICGIDGEDFADMPNLPFSDKRLWMILPGLFNTVSGRVCPKCGRTYFDPPAISRRKPIEICPLCGQREAFEDYRQACQKRKNAVREGDA